MTNHRGTPIRAGLKNMSDSVKVNDASEHVTWFVSAGAGET